MPMYQFIMFPIKSQLTCQENSSPYGIFAENICTDAVNLMY